jgi:hypothetical protein
MWALRAFGLGGAAAAAVAYVFAATAGLVAAAAGLELTLALGPLVLVAVELEGPTTATTIGGGLAAVALAGAVANLIGAAVLRRRRDRGRIA